MVGKWRRESSPVSIPGLPFFVPVPQAAGAAEAIAIDYYDQLEKAQRGGLGVTDWVTW